MKGEGWLSARRGVGVVGDGYCRVLVCKSDAQHTHPLPETLLPHKGKKKKEGFWVNVEPAGFAIF